MSADPLLPIAPARVKALVLPVGQIRRQRFASFLDRLAAEQVVQLRDISPDGRPNRNMFSPLAFPDGAMFYELTTHYPHPSYLTLTPFDLYREPFVVIAVADASEIDRHALSKRQSGGGRTTTERNIRGLYQDLEDLRDQFPKVLVHRLLLFDYVENPDEHVPIPEDITTIPPPQDCKRTTMRTVMCDIASQLLAEMTSMAKQFEALSYVDSPGQIPTGQPNGQDPMHARRNSQFSLPGGTNGGRSSSAAATNRMSMPVLPKGSGFGSAGSTPIRPSTPVKSGLSNTPNLDDGSSEFSSGPPTPEQPNAVRPGTNENFRTVSQDRISVQGFGSGGLNERWRSKGKGRVTIILGSLYLQAGRWPDALNHLTEGATVARSINDHVWHGKALELIVICLLLLGWAGVEFQVPSVLLAPTSEKTSASAAAAMAADEKNASPTQPRWFRNLQVILPDLLDRIIALYSRISAEHLPPLPMAEAIIRCSRTLTGLHLTDGCLEADTLGLLVLGRAPTKVLSSSPRLTVTPSRTLIVNMLFKAFPNSSTEMLSAVDRIAILSGIASVLGMLGYQRQKAMVIRELVSVLIGGLVEARTRGAAEVGIHPAAGLAALNGVSGHTTGAAALDLGEGDIEESIDVFLGLLLRTYGVVSFEMDTLVSPTKDMETAHTDDGAVVRIQKQAAARFFGIPALKLNILRACINFSEALPDFNGVLKYSSDLLRTAGSGLAPGPRREDAAPIISKDEQVRLITNILKTSSLSQRLGMGEMLADFWDEFFLRGVKLEPLPRTRATIEHKKSELAGASTARESQDVDPLIHNPFLKPPDKAAVESTLVAFEPATFKLTLQNPYEIEVEIESVRLDTEGVEFESSVDSALIGPYRTQILRLVGIPKAAGSLKITGAIIKVRGCRERRFPIFPSPWSPEDQPKVKAIGLAALEQHVLEPASQAPKTDHISLNVIDEQPVVVVKSTSLAQSSVMILEGESQVFSVTLQNLSKTTAADFLLFSFQDSTQEPLQAALSKRNATPQELYEYELILARKQALRLKPRADHKRYIGPGEEATFDFQILGKPGLTGGIIQVDYAHLGVPPEDVPAKFHTRQVALQLTITVNASVELTRVDVLPLHEGIPRPLLETAFRRGDGASSLKEIQEKVSSDDYCLLLLDLRNAWPSYMQVELSTEDGALIEETILPGYTSRVMVLLKRVYLEDPHAAVPTLNPARQRQFVVSTTISPETERANREAFWYREELLNRIKGSWRATSGTNRHGAIELRSIRLSPRMIDAVKIEDVDIDISVASQNPGDDESKNVLYVDEFSRLNVHIINRSAKPIYPTLRLMPALCHRPLNVALDYTRKFGWIGTLQKSLPLLEAHGETNVVMTVAALCRGQFEVTASVEETQLWRDEGATAKGSDEGGRPRSDTQTLMDAVLGARERRIWHTRKPFTVTALDRDG
ncbi:hypothetical protein MCOR02_007265 [Pyricularia oryzae]|nr:hypothetical protein MCOR02_007265 [Pyricularia oryzae]